MNIHKNARLTYARRGELGRRASCPGACLSALAREFAVSRQTVYKWRRRYQEHAGALADRSSRPHRSPTQLRRVARRQVERRRRQRWSSCRIASDLGLPIATVVRAQRRLGLARLAALTPPRPILRYEWPQAGDLLHLDVKKLGKIGRVGHRIHGDRTARVRGIGWEYVHVAIIEEEDVPSDAAVVDQTWAKANKDGSPDRRLANNFAIPVAAYGMLDLMSASGLNGEYMVSNLEATQRFARTWAQFIAATAAA